MVQLFAVLFLTFYAISYFMGLSEMNQSEILKMVLKIGIIYLLISPNSWYWYKIFFVDTFKNGVNYIIFLMSVTFDRDPEILSAINNYDFSNKTLLFKSSDRIFRLLFDDVMHKKILGLIFNNLFGIIYVLVIYYAILIYLRAFFTSISFFLIAYTQMSIMLIFGPIFILFIFFSRTERLFKNWYENLISFSLQMIFLSLFLSFFNSIIYELIKMNFNYMVCWGTVWSIPIIDIGSIFEFWSLPSTGMGLNPNNSIVSDAPKLLSIILLYFVCKAMLDFIDYGSALSAKIAGNLRIGGQAMELGGAPIESIKITAGQAKSYLMKKTGAGEYLAERKDMFLDKHFDSGKIADKRHNLQKRDNAKVRKKELSIRSAGDMADRQYLKDHNIKDTRTLTKEQKLSMQNRRDKAMSQKAEDMGIDLDTKDGQEEFKSLKEARGNKMTDREKNSLTHLATSKLKEKYSKLSTYDAERTIPVANARSAEQSKYYNRQENDSDKGDKSKAGADIGLGSGGKPAAEGGIGLGSGGKSAAEGGIGLGGEADKAPPESGDKDVAKGPALDADKDSASASVSEDSALPSESAIVSKDSTPPLESTSASKDSTPKSEPSPPPPEPADGGGKPKEKGKGVSPLE
ncbi:type IV secretion system protein [Rickettsiales bacterium]|nr:type IV secretion system protein [Rickettsiales bacterium]